MVTIVSDGDDTLDVIHKYKYDSEGRFLSRIITYKDTEKTFVQEERTYGKKGNLIKKVIDDPGVGSPNDIYEITYDKKGNKRTSKWTSIENAEGTPDEVRFSVYDKVGNTISYAIDENADGEYTEVSKYTLDENGNRLIDSSFYLGQLLALNHYEYNEFGKKTKRTSFGYPDFKEPDYYEFWIYDEKQNLLLSMDMYSTGELHRMSRYTYDYNGNKTRVETDFNGDWVADRIGMWVYDERGNLLEETTDNIKYDRYWKSSYTYDENNNKLTESKVKERDGVPHYVIKYLYDTNNRVIAENHDTNADGAIDVIKSFTYEGCYTN